MRDPFLVGAKNENSVLTNDERPIVLITFNPHETREVVNRFCPSSKPQAITRDGIPYYSLGRCGGSDILLTVSRQSVTRACAAAEDAIDHWNPQALIGVGIAFGVNPAQQDYGDVLVSESVYDYELLRENDEGQPEEPRGVSEAASDDLVRRLKAADHFGMPWHPGWPKVWFGCVLSGNKLLDNATKRDVLVSQAGGLNRVIGGEMEALGLSRAVGRAGRKKAAVSWIIVKGICDFADGSVNNTDKDANQSFAAYNAALVVYTALFGKDNCAIEDASDQKNFDSQKQKETQPTEDRGDLMFPQRGMDEIQLNRSSIRFRKGTDRRRIEDARELFESLALKLDQNHGEAKAFIVVDLDRFTIINAVYGEAVGDLVLKHVHSVLSSWCNEKRQPEHLKISSWRSSSDEWFLLVSGENTTNETWLEQITKDLLKQIKDSDYSVIVDGLFVTACAGVVRRHDQNESAQHLLRRAFQGLKKAKRLGGNSCCLGPIEVRSLDEESAELELEEIAWHLS